MSNIQSRGKGRGRSEINHVTCRDVGATNSAAAMCVDGSSGGTSWLRLLRLLLDDVVWPVLPVRCCIVAAMYDAEDRVAVQTATCAIAYWILATQGLLPQALRQALAGFVFLLYRSSRRPPLCLPTVRARSCSSSHLLFPRALGHPLVAPASRPRSSR